jgi:tRNA threonylcarbamoyladenosine biosynthesis protein TsaB
MIDNVLKEAGITLTDLNAFAVTVGPGSFTGVRIGTAMMQALSFASGIPVVPVSTLRAMAQEAYIRNRYEQVFVRLDAGKNEIFGACFCLDEIGIKADIKKGIMSAVTQESVMDPNNLVLPDGNWVTVQSPPTAASVLAIAAYEYERGAAVSAEELQPVYISAGHYNPS